jgi:predicted metal-dependent HD superfamily phosphohydrolase
MDLRERFNVLWERLDARGNPDKVFAELIACYKEPHRRYHNVTHLEFGLSQFDLISGLARHPDWVEFAFFFHDGVYIIGATDNEERSAQLAKEVLKKAQVPVVVRLHVVANIMTTKPGEKANSPDQQIIADIDLAILGQPRNVFVEYERQVREEYASVPEEVFWQVRKGILQNFLNRSSIFSTSLFRDLYEGQARENLSWTIGQH